MRMSGSAGKSLLCFAAIAAVSLSCSKGGEGILVVTTTPVAGEIIVDGVQKGHDRCVLTIGAGEHTIDFGLVSNQFVVPKTIVAKVTKNDTTFVTGVYANAFIPAEPPKGFALADSIRYYGTIMTPLKDGNVFDYIDGGARIYLDYGLIVTVHARYRHEDGSELVLDIFDMGTAARAKPAFAEEQICPAGFTALEIGDGCKSYNFAPDFMLYILKSQYLIYVSTTNDYLKDDVIAFAKTVASAVP